MILYQALSSYQILECILHRQVFYREKKAVLILGNYITERMPWYRELESRGFFDQIFLFRFGGYKGTEEEILCQVAEEYKKTIPYAPEEFENLLIAGIHTYLQAWFISREISFEMFEDGSGALSRPWILADIHKKSSPARYALIEKYHLYDHESPWITRKYCDMKAQLPGFSDEKAQDFQVLETFRGLSLKLQENIRSLFRLPHRQGGEEEVLLLTQQFANLGQLSLEEQKSIYQHIFTYYLEGKKVLIKPHPDDILYYSRLFPHTRILKDSFPSELLPFVFEKLPRTLCTVSSTGVNQIRQEFLDTLIFNALYEKSFHQDGSYYTALCLAKYLLADGILCYGTNQVQLENLAKVHWPQGKPLKIAQDPDMLKEQKRILQIRDDFQEKSREGSGRPDASPIPEERLLGILYLNSGKKYSMYQPGEKEKFFQMIPFPIREGENYHTIYFYPIKKEVRSMTEKFPENGLPKQAPVSIEAMTDSQIQICMLEGILTATEKRLLEYIEMEKELREELDGLKQKGGSQ